MTKVKTTKMNHFTISYYEGEGQDDDLKSVSHGRAYPKDGQFFSMISAAIFCQEHGFHLSQIQITEWDPNNTDAFGIPEIVGSCNLQEAYECDYHHLTF